MNNSSTESSGLSPFLITLRTCFIYFTGLLIISGNILSIAVTRRVSNLADSTKVLMTTLAVYDLLVGLLALVNGLASALDRWPLGDLGCQIFAGVTMMVFFMSVSSIIFLNIERYIAVTRPYKFPVWFTRRRVIALMILVSGFSLGNAIILQIMFGVPAQYFSAAVGCSLVTGSGVEDATTLILLDIFPVVTMVCIYYRLIKISREHQQRINPNEANVPDNKALKTFLIVTLTFSGCFTPLLFLKTLESLADVSSPHWLQFITAWLTYYNSAFNVIIYCLFNQAYRQTAKKIITARLPWCSHSVAPVNI